MKRNRERKQSAASPFLLLKRTKVGKGGVFISAEFPIADISLRKKKAAESILC